MTATTEAAAQTAGPAIGHRQVLVVFSGLMLAMLLAALDSTIVATALPTIVGDLGGLSPHSWVAAAYLLAQTVVTPDLWQAGLAAPMAVIAFVLTWLLPEQPLRQSVQTGEPDAAPGPAHL